MNADDWKNMFMGNAPSESYTAQAKQVDDEIAKKNKPKPLPENEDCKELDVEPIESNKEVHQNETTAEAHDESKESEPL